MKLVIIILISFLLLGCSKPKYDIDKSLSQEIKWVKLSFSKSDKFSHFFKAGVWNGDKFILLISDTKALVSSTNGTEWSKFEVDIDGTINDIIVVNDKLFLEINRR